MAILVDGDGCPGISQIKELAQDYALEMTVFVDYAHIIEDDYYNVVFCEVGKDSVDQAIIAVCKKDDLVITQDYGLASLVLLKGSKVLHPSGKVITNDNINQLLINRYIFAKQRKEGQRTNGPAKRNDKVHSYFLKQLEKLLN